MEPFDRAFLIKIGGGLTVTLGGQLFYDLRSYYEVMEASLGSLEKNLTKDLKRKSSKFSPQIQEYIEKYKWNPRWDILFQQQFRVSIIISTISVFESYLSGLCGDVKEIVRAPISFDDIKGGSTKRAQKFLEVFGRLERPTESTWKQIHQAIEMRNLLVHSGGELDSVPDLKRVQKLAESMPGLDFDEELGVIINRELCDHYLYLVEKFHNEAKEGMEELCSRYKIFNNNITEN